MSAQNPRFLVTGAGGQLGQLVIDSLLAKVPAAQIAALVRKPEAAAALTARGIHAFIGDYTTPASLDAALAGIDRLLLISSSEVGQRAAQHANVIAAAKRAGVPFIAYTSILGADHSPLALAEEHQATEALLKASGLAYALLRNGWYTENYVQAIQAAVAHGVHLGSAGDGRIAAAARADYAEAAARVLVSGQSGVYELAGDTGFTLAEFAAEIARQSGKPVVYKDLAEADYKAALIGVGLPDAFAAILANSDAGAAKGGLYSDSHALSTLIGRPTTPIVATITQVLQG